MALRTVVGALLFFGSAPAERLPEYDLTDDDGDTTAMLQLHSDIVSSVPASIDPEAQAQAALKLGFTPGQIAANVAGGIIAGAGVSADKASELVKSLDVEALGDGLAEAFKNHTINGSLSGRVDMQVTFEAPEVISIFTKWLDHAALVLKEEKFADVQLLSKAMAAATRTQQGPAVKDPTAAAAAPDPTAGMAGMSAIIAILGGLLAGGGGEGADVLAPLLGSVIGTAADVTVDNDAGSGKTEVSVRVDAPSFFSIAEQCLGDFADALEEAGVADAFIRAGVPEVGREFSLLERQHVHGIAEAMGMMKAFVNQTLCRGHMQSREAQAVGAKEKRRHSEGVEIL